MWPDVVYEPGELRAVAYMDGAKWCEETVRTTGEPARLALEEEPVLPQGRAQSAALAVRFLTCRIVDERGDTVPRTRIPVRIEVDGGEFVAADNGDESDMEWYRSPVRRAFNGLLSIVVRTLPNATDPIRVRVSAAGLAPAELTL